MFPAVVINYWAVLVAAIAATAIGMLWYGPLFGRQWMSMAGMTQKGMKNMKLKPAQSMTIGFVTTLLMAYVLAHFVAYAKPASWIEGLQTGLWIWLGFLATTMLGMVLWEGKPFKLYVLNTAYYLVSLAVMGAILAAWP